MHRDLQVDTDQLGRFSRALGESLTSLTEARRALEHARAGQLGTPELDEACDGFQKRWKYGAEQLGVRIKAVREGVHLSREGYVQLNRSIEAAFRTVTPHDGGGRHDSGAPPGGGGPHDGGAPHDGGVRRG